jgi:hypothetical protein
MLPGDFAQELTRRCERTFRANLIRNSLIVSGLRFLYVGYRNQSDLEALFRLFELPRNRLPVSVKGCEPILSGQDVEICLPDANDQILLSGFAIGFCLGHRLIRTAEIHYLVPSEQSLPKTDLPKRIIGVAIC